MADAKDTAAPAPTNPPLQDELVVTEHRLTLGNRALDYSVTCGTLVLREDEHDADGQRSADKPRAALFFIAYTLKNPSDSPRPITFSFNGGPGSSSVWLHLGILGPQRVSTDDMGNVPPPPYALQDNEHTLLTDSDLVFIDPIGTGHSRMAEGEKVAEFHEYQRDLDSVGEFIRLYLTRFGRWESPKYLIGESYGTTRAAGLTHHLQDKHDVFLNGVMLVSLAIDLQTLEFDHGNELPFPLFLPTYAATAWYHKALAADLQALPLGEVIAQAEAFALGDYTVALMRGSRLDAATRQRIAEQVARWSGLSVEYVLRCDLRPTEFRYFKELLRHRGQTVGRLDSRFLGFDRDDAGEKPETDAAMANLIGAYAAGINRLLKTHYQFEKDAPYVVHAPLWQKWSWKDFANRYANVGASLRRAMHANPHMRVYVASGYYDLATPHAAGDYTLSHLGIRESLQGNIRVSYFEAGHMMYIHQPSLARMAQELREFVSVRSTA
ncbi:S10 family peptidase [Piscinibacter terrae]|uniref:Peptidase S10 n=1 Tax=Piscinibacter terrae TaxID=2496871 RepID=A0A3N7HVH8_9BURK|nr:peptidase S10 [Albitalea terrae]RQP26307.1 peptidase S10 [Albitalea terrae]